MEFILNICLTDKPFCIYREKNCKWQMAKIQTQMTLILCYIKFWEEFMISAFLQLFQSIMRGLQELQKVIIQFSDPICA